MKARLRWGQEQNKGKCSTRKKSMTTSARGSGGPDVYDLDMEKVTWVTGTRWSVELAWQG